MSIEIVYPLVQEQKVFLINLGTGMTVQDAIEQSGILQRYPDIDLSANRVGIFGKLVKLDQVLKERDRIEIYRPLQADPKEVRRQRAEKMKAESQTTEANKSVSDQNKSLTNT